MPIVFVHGVNNREGPEYDAGVIAQREFFQTHLGGVKVGQVGGKTLPAVPDVTFPYWGGLGTTFAWDMASLPTDEMQALGGEADATTSTVAAHILDALGKRPADEPLTTLAKQTKPLAGFPLAVDALTRMALAAAEKGKEAEVAAFVVKASAYAEPFATSNTNPEWVATVDSDSEFINELLERVEAAPAGGGVQALGGFTSWVGDKLKEGGQRVKDAVTGLAGTALDRAGDFASTKFLAWKRDSLNATLGRFFGDVFYYFNGRGDKDAPGPIPLKVLDAFDKAGAAAAAANEPLVIVGHSMGGVISMDLLGRYRPDLQVDLFVSVGSQVAHFEEIKLYHLSDKAVTAASGGKAKTPANIRRWINIFDPVDIFSYAASRVFDRVDVDGSYDTKTYVIKAHSAYFEQADFYKRLRARVEGLA